MVREGKGRVKTCGFESKRWSVRVRNAWRRRHGRKEGYEERLKARVVGCKRGSEAWGMIWLNMAEGGSVVVVAGVGR